jgi:site-specific DNA-methyltransferase (adenine-specific)
VKEQTIYTGDCLDVVRDIKTGSIDVIYLDPPFFTQKEHALKTRDNGSHYSFSDKWEGQEVYVDFLLSRMEEFKRVLKDTGSVFFHCDKAASHLARWSLEQIFGNKNFQAEIIWSYRRWSNSANGLLPAHQNIYFFSKSRSFKFHKIYGDYSPSTNIDQILQARSRDTRNKSVYAKDKNGVITIMGKKEGVPLSDVWDIPYLNPKAKERVGYPTQKPLLLLERILSIVSDEGDVVLDPFLGSGTTLVACSLMGRKGIGIDISPDAIELCKKRLANPVRTESKLLENGRESYLNKDPFIEKHLWGIDCHRVQRNQGIDALLKTGDNIPVPIRVQRFGESLSEAGFALKKASKGKGVERLYLIQTQDGSNSFLDDELPNEVTVLKSLAVQLLNERTKI